MHYTDTRSSSSPSDTSLLGESPKVLLVVDNTAISTQTQTHNISTPNTQLLSAQPLSPSTKPSPRVPRHHMPKHFLTVQDPVPVPLPNQTSSRRGSGAGLSTTTPTPLNVELSEFKEDSASVPQMRNPSDVGAGKDAQEFRWTAVAWELLTGSKLNVLLIFVPVAITAQSAGWSAGVVFFSCVLGLIPLAAMLGDCTEQVALHTNETIGGLLNATFGNATELIISIFALKNGLLRIIQVSLLGSIISNMLLVLGSSFIVGGFKYKMQTFNRHMISTNSGLLLLAVIGLVFPAVLALSGDDRNDINSELILSRGSAVLLLITYISYIAFQLKTHSYLFDEKLMAQQEKQDNIGLPVPENQSEENAQKIIVQDSDNHFRPLSPSPAAKFFPEDADGDDGEDEQTMTFWQAVFFLGSATTLVAVLSEFAVGAIEGAAENTGLPQIFIGAIILPIVGNAAEHASAVTVAYRNKMTLSLGIAIGSSTQIALFGIPFMVIVSWIAGQPLSMYFRAYETAVVFSSVVILSFVVSDGKSTWLKGLMLCVAYLIAAIGFFVHKDD